MNIVSDNALKGAIAQTKAEARALEKGFIVSKPIFEQTRYDMVIDDGVNISRIQIKYAGGKQSQSTGSAVVDFRKITNNGKHHNGYQSNEVDAIIVYLPQIDKLCYFPIEMVNSKTTLTIRYKETKSGQTKNIIYAKDYIW